MTLMKKMTYALVPIFYFYTTYVSILALIFLQSHMFIKSEIMWALPSIIFKIAIYIYLYNFESNLYIIEGIKIKTYLLN